MVKRRAAARPGPKSSKKTKPSVEPDEDEQYEVEALMGIQYNVQKETIEYMVKWKNYPMRSVGWEPEENVANALQMMQRFEDAAKYMRERFMDGGYVEDDDEDSDNSRKYKDHWEVEVILGIKLDPTRNQIQYLIKWKDWNDSYNNWEPKWHVTNCNDLIKPFKKSAVALEDAQEDFADELPKPKPEKEIEDVEVDVSENEKYALKVAKQSKKPGPKSKTSGKKPGPKSKTQVASPAKKRPGPKSKTAVSAKRPGPKSRTTRNSAVNGGGDNGSDEENRSPIKRRGREVESNPSEDEDEVVVPETKSRPGPASKKGRPGPKSRTSAR